MIAPTATMTELVAIARDYCRIHRVGRVADRQLIQCDADYHRRVANAYGKLPVRRWADKTYTAYHRLSHEIADQFAFLLDRGYRFSWFGDDMADPYGNRSEAMIADVVGNGHLWVYTGGADHPHFTNHQNAMFRAVHDVFGHALHRYSFGPNGEESAYRCHLAMFSESAGLAMATETRGQNSWVNFGPQSHLPRAERPFAEQKMAILPEEFRTAY